MIQFDNGPPGGDYVRYIDTLLAQRFPDVSMTGDAFRAPSQTMMQPVDDRIANPSRRTDTTPTPRLSPIQAAAAATALTAGAERAARAAGFANATVPDIVAALEVVGVAVAALLVLLGLFAPGLGAVFVVAGIALAVSMIQRILRRRGVLPAALVKRPR